MLSWNRIAGILPRDTMSYESGSRGSSLAPGGAAGSPSGHNSAVASGEWFVGGCTAAVGGGAEHGIAHGPRQSMEAFETNFATRVGFWRRR
jgi:hypothetical protein